MGEEKSRCNGNEAWLGGNNEMRVQLVVVEEIENIWTLVFGTISGFPLKIDQVFERLCRESLNVDLGQAKAENQNDQQNANPMYVCI